tara:strand:+ start:21 stop:482 length:462 start_codon:yes stop_codon:yes gene_type:complete
MDNPMNSVNKLLGTVTKSIDDNVESSEERQKTLTERQRIDLTSAFKLPHLIRPIAFIWAMGLQTILAIMVVVMAFKSDPVDTNSILLVVGSNAAVLTTIVGFYFQSRKSEKIEFQKMQTAIKIKEIEATTEATKEKFNIKEAKKDNRARRRKG